MNIRLVMIVLWTSLCGQLHAEDIAASGAVRPNIVFIIADDLGFADCGFNGGKQIKTPNLDKLAASGAILKQFYVQPVCSPTRASLMTGRYPIRYGLQVSVIRPTARYGLSLEERMLPAALRDAGYSTGMIGKWHLGSFDEKYWPNARGFDYFYGHLYGALDYDTHQRDGKLDWYQNTQKSSDKGYTTHLLAREAGGFINRQVDSKPFFLYVPFNAVHGPLQVPGRYMEPYAHLQGSRRKLAGMLAAMDEAVGQIVKAIDEKGLRKNTLFIFSSDNGGPNPGSVTDNNPLRAGKGTVYEGGVRVCAFAAWQGVIKPGSKVDAMIHMVDWYPTLLKLGGASREQKLPLDGRDIWACITANGPTPHEEIIHNITPNGGAIRVGDWKLVVHEQPQADEAGKRKGGNRQGRLKVEEELYNIPQDISEKNNLAASHPDKVKEMRARYDAHAKAAAKPLAGSGADE